MSVERCHNCDKYIDTDYDAEHFDEHQEDRDRALFEELTVAEISEKLGYEVKVVKERSEDKEE